MAKKPKAKVDSIVDTAKKRFELAKEAYAANRTLAIEDTKFVMGDSDNQYQWPADVMRAQDKQVRLTVNVTAQHCNQVINNIRQNPPQCSVAPGDGDAHEDTAKMLAGMIRAIQRDGGGDDATDCAMEHGVYGGEGYWRLVTEYDTDDSFDQIIRRKIIQNPNLVYIDPYCKEIDKSDATWGFVFEDITKEDFERDYPGIDPANWSQDSNRNGWATDTTVRIAEYYCCEYEDDTLYLLHDGTKIAKSDLPPGVDLSNLVANKRTVQKKKWKWYKMVGGQDEPIEETDWLGSYLPIIAVVGKELNINGEIIRKGLVRDLKDPARMVNYSFSATVQTLALQNKVPYMSAVEAIEGFENQWRGANTENLAYLPFNAYDEEGKPLPVPQRQQPAVMPAAQVQLLQLSTEQMRAASGQQNANFGIKSEAQSGVGIQRLKSQGDIATFHFPDNFARALKYEAKLLIDIIPKLYDTQRIVNIVGVDGKTETAILAPAMQSAYHEESQNKAFNPNIGRYSVVITVGPSYQTQRQEAFTMLSEMAARNPELMQVAGDIIVRAGDFPMAEQLADRLEKTLPPNLADQKDGQPEIPPQVQQQMQVQQQHLDQAVQTMQAMEERLQVAERGEQSKIAQTQAKAQTDQAEIEAKNQREYDAIQKDAEIALHKASIEAATKIEIAQKQMQSDMELEEMRGYFQLLAARKEEAVPALRTDVEGEFADDASAPVAPVKRTRKRMQIMAPSGQVYHGTIQDEPIDEGVE